jgi:hypothetical protein
MSCWKTASKTAWKAAALVLPLLLGASGCHEYKYVNVPASFEQASFDDSEIGTIHTCKITVSGADSDSFYLAKCPDLSKTDPHDLGTFEYSTFADSGTLKFELEAFTGLNQTDACRIGAGSVTVPVSGLTTIMANPLIVVQTGPGCLNNVSDAGQ